MKTTAKKASKTNQVTNQKIEEAKMAGSTIRYKLTHHRRGRTDGTYWCIICKAFKPSRHRVIIWENGRQIGNIHRQDFRGSHYAPRIPHATSNE